ncbi:MAG: class I SAM-dependent methyltransferase [Methanosarcinales archaeon]|nr:MAG: class I SAM-dependent methyltransferase [Methanosarcinales archaeon]
MTRDKHTVKFTKQVHSNQYGMRLATPEIVAGYIASRLRTHTIADLGCGIGIQAIFFAKQCTKVYAVELDSERLDYARENARLYGVSNIEFILADALSDNVIKRLSGVDIVFSDPARLLQEKERRLERSRPPILEIIRKYQHITDRMAFHLPPKINPEKIFFDCEREYLSLNGQLNRFTVYLGSLKKCGRSAVVLPEGARLESKPVQPIAKTSTPRDFIFEPQPSVVHAGLLGELNEHLPADAAVYYSDQTRTLITSDSLLHLPFSFLKDCYHVICATDFKPDKIKRALVKGNAKKVVLRFQIEPLKYWNMRNMFEEGLSGDKTVHLFRCNNTAVVCEKVQKEQT